MTDTPTKLVHDDVGMYTVKEVGEHRFDVVQTSSGVVVASAAGKVTAQRAASTINACAIVPRMIAAPIRYQPLTPDCGAPSGTHNFFLVRPQGIHPASNAKYIPSAVQMIDGNLYATDNEIEPLVWSMNGNLMEGPTEDPYQGKLEWMPLPE